jgi:hypothetical protein
MNGLPGYWVANNNSARVIPVATRTEPVAVKEPVAEEVAKQVRDMVKTLNNDMASLAGQLRALGQKRSVTFATRSYQEAPRKRQQIPQEILKRITCFRCGEKGHMRWQCDKKLESEKKATDNVAGSSKITEL